MKKSSADTSENLDKIRLFLNDVDWATVDEIREKTGIPRSTVQRVMERSPEYIESRYNALAGKGRPVKQYRLISGSRDLTALKNELDIVRSLSNSEDLDELRDVGFTGQFQETLLTLVESSIEGSKNEFSEISLPDTHKLLIEKLLKNRRMKLKLQQINLNSQKTGEILEKLSWGLMRKYFELKIL